MSMDAPRVWVGCLHCYNNGRLVGDWFEADERGSLDDIEEVHDRSDAPLTESCEELWVMDHENIPEKGEMSTVTADEWLSAYEDIDDDDQWEAFYGWIQETGNDASSSADFVDYYQGLYHSTEDFAQELAEETMEIPESMATYFDYDKWTHDVMMDYTAVDASGGMVHIIRDF